MDPFSIAGMIGGLGSALGGLFGRSGNSNKNNPATAANKQIGQIPGQVKPYYDPYINAGKGALDDLTKRYQDNLNNPGELYNKLAGGYTESPGYANTLRTALSGANNAAAMGGQLGLPQHQQIAADAAGGVASKDFEQYLQHMLGIYGTGLSGEQGLETQGYNASTGYGDILGQIGGQKAAYDYAGQDWKNQNRKQNMSDIFSGLSSAGSSYFLGPQIDALMQKYLSSSNNGGH